MSLYIFILCQNILFLMLLKAQKNGTIKGVWIYWHSIHEPFTLCRWLLYFFANDIIFFLNSKIKKYIKKSVMWQPAWLSPDRKKKKNNYTIVVNDRSRICSLYISRNEHLQVNLNFSSLRASFSWHITEEYEINKTI